MKNIGIIFSVASMLFFQSCIKDNEDPVKVSPVEGAIVNEIAVGGASQPNQVWIDLSDVDENNQPKQTVTPRTKWDLGFYSGDEFKVILNYSALMAATKIDGVTNIDAVTESSVSALIDKVQVANFDPENTIYIDDVKGKYNTGYTTIAEVKANDAENGIYLVNMGREIYEGTIPAGSTITGGDSRGWMKVQILTNGDGYKIKYAKLNETSHKEYIITKKEAHSFTFFSMISNSEVEIQPEKSKWDISFTVFVNSIDGAGSYIYSDFVTNNILGGVAAYQVTVPAGSNSNEFYNNFKSENIDTSKFSYDDHRTIGSSWRLLGPGGGSMYGDRFYVVRDSEGVYYKIKFIGFTNVGGERGHPQFEYKPL